MRKDWWGSSKNRCLLGLGTQTSEPKFENFAGGAPRATDQELIKVVAEAMAIEKARASKMAGGKEVCYLGVSVEESVQNPKPNANNISKKKENLLPAQIVELQATQDKLVASICELQSAMASTNNLLATRLPNLQNFSNPNFTTGMGQQQQNFGQQQNFRRNKKAFCQPCLNKNAQRCPHCFHCGSEDGHKIKDCPSKNQANNQGAQNGLGGGLGGSLGGGQNVQGGGQQSGQQVPVGPGQGNC